MFYWEMMQYLFLALSSLKLQTPTMEQTYITLHAV